MQITNRDAPTSVEGKVDVAEAVVSFEHVIFGYGSHPAVENITFAVPAGDYVAIIGPNGSGKTTLIRLALGLEQPQGGAVRLFDRPVREFREWNRIGYVPQRASAFNVRFPATVSDVVSLGRYRGFDPRGIFRRGVSAGVREALESVEMWDLRDRLIGDLSGGQQQRVLVARAIANHPDLLVLDEPTDGIDQNGQDQFYGLVRKVREMRGTTVVLISHDFGLVRREASRVACIDRVLLAYQRPNELDGAALEQVFGHRFDAVHHQHGR